MAELVSDFRPFCFDREEFTEPEFNVERFLWKVKKSGHSLERIRDDLRVYLKILQNSMIELINEDYADFVNLSSNLVGLQGPVRKLDASFDEFRQTFASVNEKAMLQARQLQERTSSWRRVEDEENGLRLELTVCSALETAKSLLCTEEATDGDNGSGGYHDDSNRRRQLTTIGRLTHVLNECCSLEEALRPAPTSRSSSSGSGSRPWSFADAFVSSLTAVIDEVQRRYTPVFSSAVRQKDVQLLGRVFQLFLSCDRYDLLQARFIAEFLEPRFNAVLGSAGGGDVVDSAGAANVGSESSESIRTLTAILPLVLDLRRTYQTVFYPSTSAASPTSVAPSVVPRKFLCQCLLTALLSFCERHLGSLFIPTDIAEFRRAFQLFVDFAHSWVTNDGDEPRKLGRRTDTCVSIILMILKKFDMQVYSHLCFQELDNAICWSSVGESAAGVHSPSSLAADIHSGLQRLWDGGEGGVGSMFIEPMVDDCAKYTFLLLNKYRQAVNAFYESWQQRHGLPVSNGNVDRTNGVSGGDDVIKSKILAAISIVEDVSRLKQLLNTFFAAQVFPKLERHRSCLEAFQRGIDETLQGVELDVCQKFERNVASALASAMSDALAKVADVPRQYRWTRKDAPSSASAYLDSAFQPLVNFVDAARRSVPAACTVASAAAVVDSRPTSLSSLADRVAETVLAEVVPRYVAAIRNVVDSVDRVSSSLSKLKRGGRSSTAATTTGDDLSTCRSALSDDAKIRIQLNTDVQEFVRRLTALFSKNRDEDHRPTAVSAAVLDELTSIVSSLSSEVN